MSSAWLPCRAWDHGEYVEETEAGSHDPIPGTKLPPADSRWALLAELIGIIQQADGALEEGDLKTARELFDRPTIWEYGELQAAARLAALALALPCSCAKDRFWRRFACATFLQRKLDPLGLRRDLLLPGLAWSPERLEALAEEVEDWLSKPADKN